MIDLLLRHQKARRIRVAPGMLLVVALLSSCSTHPHGSDMVSSHVIAITMDDAGAIRPDAYFLRNRYLEPKSEQEILRILTLERAEPPIREGHIAIRARNRWGRVIYRTMVEVALVGESTCCPHVDFRIQAPGFVAVVPATATAISIEGWLSGSRITLDLQEIRSNLERP